MSSLLSYKNYNGTVEYSDKNDCLCGKVIGLKSLISYEGHSVEELKGKFKRSIDTYLEACEKLGVEPEQQYKGSFNVRISPELHRSVAMYAMKNGKSLNAAVEEAIRKLVEEHTNEL